MTFGSLFAGIGGFDLGLERAGMECRWQVENDPYAVRVLERHWPEVKRFGDIETVSGGQLESVDLICGGFPCQDISAAGKGGGILASRSGLWKHFARLVGEVRPRFALIENSPALRGRGLAVVLQDLDALGFDAEWHCVPAAALGAPHQRDRIYVLAYAQGFRGGGLPVSEQQRAPDGSDAHLAGDDPQAHAADVAGVGCRGRAGALSGEAGGRTAEAWRESSGGDATEPEGFGQRTRRARGSHPSATRKPEQALHPALITHADFAGSQERQVEERVRELASAERTSPANPDGEPLVGAAIARGERHAWTVEPGVVRMVHGFPHRVDRIRCLGNAVVPQVAEWLGRQILRADAGL